MPSPDRRPALPGLTALRFFAALYVLLYHTFPPEGAVLKIPTLLQHWLGQGFTAVSCFFVLSGFILAYTHPRVDAPLRFYRARFARVYPLYLLALLLMLPNFVANAIRTGRHQDLWAIPAHLLLLQTWVPPIALLINTPAWTLSCEAFFYLLFPALAGSGLLRTRRPVLLLLGLWILSVLPPALSAYLIVPTFPARASLMSSVLLLPIFRLCEFLAGMVLGSMFLERQPQSAGLSEGSPTAAPPWWLLLSIVLCLAILGLSWRLPHEVVRNGLMIGPFCLLIWTLAGRSPRLLASPALQLGGEISYGIYLLQDPVSHLSYSVLRHLPGNLLPGHSRILLVFPAAWLTYVTVEKPCRNWLLGRGWRSTSKPIPTPQPSLP